MPTFNRSSFKVFSFITWIVNLKELSDELLGAIVTAKNYDHNKIFELSLVFYE